MFDLFAVSIMSENFSGMFAVYRWYSLDYMMMTCTVQVISIVQFNSMITIISTIIFVESHAKSCYLILAKFTFKVVTL